MTLRRGTRAWAQAARFVGWLAIILSTPALLAAIAFLLVSLPGGEDETAIAAAIAIVLGVPAGLVVGIGVSTVLLVRRGLRDASARALIGAATLLIVLTAAQLTLLLVARDVGLGVAGVPLLIVLAVPGGGLLLTSVRDVASPDTGQTTG